MRRFEFVQGTSAKFWMGDVEGNDFVVVYGRLGTAGQRKAKGFPSGDAARRELEKKIAEKLREGYHEVSAAAGAAAGAKGAAAASARLELPPRVRAGERTEARIGRARAELSALEAARGRRSFAIAWRVRRARRALEALGGIDPAADPAFAPLVDAVLARVVAAQAADRLPLRRAMELLQALDAAAFARAVQETWKNPPQGSPAAGAIAALQAELAALGDAELGLRLGALLVDRPGQGLTASEVGWARRWQALAPHLEAHLARGGGSLAKLLGRVEASAGGAVDDRLARMRG